MGDDSASALGQGRVDEDLRGAVGDLGGVAAARDRRGRLGALGEEGELRTERLVGAGVPGEAGDVVLEGLLVRTRRGGDGR